MEHGYLRYYVLHGECHIVDDYINCHTLSLLSAKKKDVNVIVFSDNKGRSSGKLNQLEFDNFNKEYRTLSIKKNN